MEKACAWVLNYFFNKKYKNKRAYVGNEIVQIGALKFFFKCCLSEPIRKNVSCLLHVTYAQDMQNCKGVFNKNWELFHTCFSNFSEG